MVTTNGFAKLFLTMVFVQLTIKKTLIFILLGLFWHCWGTPVVVCATCNTFLFLHCE